MSCPGTTVVTPSSLVIDRSAMGRVTRPASMVRSSAPATMVTLAAPVPVSTSLSSVSSPPWSCGLKPNPLGGVTRYGDLDTYHMAASAIDEAIRNCVAVGADPMRIAILLALGLRMGPVHGML